MAFAWYENDQAIVACIAHVQVDTASGAVRVKRMVVAHDCGLIINPDGLKNQIEGNVIQSLSRTLKEEVMFDEWRIKSVDWDSYPILTFSEVPEVEIVLINRPDQPALGAGEPATVTTAAAVANAIFDATGARLRQIPFTPERVMAALQSAFSALTHLKHQNRPCHPGIEQLGFARHWDADGPSRQLAGRFRRAPGLPAYDERQRQAKIRLPAGTALHVRQVDFQRLCRLPDFLPASRARMGSRKCAPIPARSTFGANASVVSGGRKTACTPAAAAVRRSVPRLPGSRIEVGDEDESQAVGEGKRGIIQNSQETLGCSLFQK